LIAALSFVTGGFAIWKIHLLQALLQGGIVVFVHRIGSRFLSARSTLIAVVLACVHPLLLWYGVRIWTEPLQTFLLLWGVDAFLRWEGERTSLRSIEIGMVFGAGALTKSVMLLLPFLLAGSTAIAGLRVSLRQRVLMLCVFLVAPCVWTVRNYEVNNAVSLVHTGGGFILVQGNQVARSWPDVPMRAMHMWDLGLRRVDSLLAGRTGGTFAPANDAYLLRVALQERIVSPLWGMAVVATNALTYWYLAETPLKSMAAGVIQLPLLIFVLLHVRRLWKAGGASRLLIVVAGYCWTAYACMFGWVRFSTPVVPVLILLAVTAFSGRRQAIAGRDAA